MRLYLDSADRSAIASLLATGIFRGVTTNPLILREARLTAAELPGFARDVFDLGAKELFLQSWGEDAGALCERGRSLAAISDRVVVKLPATRAGIEAAAGLAAEGVRICLTALFAPRQALLAAAVGAAYAAPYLGRMNDAGLDGHALIAEMVEVARGPEAAARATAPREARAASPLATEILAASIRHVDDLVILARNGVPCATLSPAVAAGLFENSLTEAATRAFEAAASGGPSPS